MSEFDKIMRNYA